MAEILPGLSGIRHAGRILSHVRRDAKCQAENGNERRRTHFGLE
ncbi:hypothetical protein OOU_Y34scaffold00580g6 [Pyricularia oryzae Y34]|uniref:Uncharacterized protein n=2 Tax=Pyricularia oryzae TaxID=318829 RepID=A0AA97NWR1_PYRO3|nr:hypothetical protein OOU_Y34scaffold00580g6 [Pyricularia oryzae Y34]